MVKFKQPDLLALLRDEGAESFVKSFAALGGCFSMLIRDQFV